MDVLYSKDAENGLLSLACTAVAITIDDTMTMYVFFHQLGHSIVLITGNKICSQEYPEPTPQKLQHMNKFTPQMTNSPICTCILIYHYLSKILSMGKCQR